MMMAGVGRKKSSLYHSINLIIAAQRSSVFMHTFSKLPMHLQIFVWHCFKYFLGFVNERAGMRLCNNLQIKLIQSIKMFHYLYSCSAKTYILFLYEIVECKVHPWGQMLLMSSLSQFFMFLVFYSVRQQINGLYHDEF